MTIPVYTGACWWASPWRCCLHADAAKRNDNYNRVACQLAVVGEVFSVPAEIHQLFTRKFPSAKCLNQVGIQLKTLMPDWKVDVSNLDIRYDDFSILAARSGKLFIAQVFVSTTGRCLVLPSQHLPAIFHFRRMWCNWIYQGWLINSHRCTKNYTSILLSVSGILHEYERQRNTVSFFFTSLNDPATCG